MFYSDLVKKACLICFDAHKEDKDKAGYPYVFHPFTLATQMEDEVSTCVALLHDVVEDHGEEYGFDRLREEGFPESVIAPLRLLTHEESVPYMDYVRSIATNAVAAKVKLADLKHNADVRRSNGAKPRKYELYLEAIAFLEKNSST